MSEAKLHEGPQGIVAAVVVWAGHIVPPWGYERGELLPGRHERTPLGRLVEQARIDDGVLLSPPVVKKPSVSRPLREVLRGRLAAHLAGMVVEEGMCGCGCGAPVNGLRSNGARRYRSGHRVPRTMSELKARCRQFGIPIALRYGG